jgi:hypothetical protein
MGRARYIVLVALAAWLAAAAVPAGAVPLPLYDELDASGGSDLGAEPVTGVPWIADVDDPPGLHILLLESGITIAEPEGPGPDALVFTIMGDVPIVIPEPGTAALIALGLVGLVRAGRPRR